MNVTYNTGILPVLCLVQLTAWEKLFPKWPRL